jgi:F-type H+-transporting ATPase subunit alpha
MNPQILANAGLHGVLSDVAASLDQVLHSHRAQLRVEEVGRVVAIGHGVARVQGLPRVRSHELVQFPGQRLGLAFNLDPDEVGIILLDPAEDLLAGTQVRRAGRVLDVPVGEGLLGRVIDGVGRPLDDQGPVAGAQRLAIERPAPAIMARDPVTVPLETGIKAIDALIPIGRGQRELILGDRQTGKTALALDTILNQRDKGVVCIYCAIGQRATAVGKVIADLREREAFEHCLVVVATEEDPPALQYITPYAAMTQGEFFMEQGRDVLVVLDDLTRHARAYREVSLLLRRPPGREAYPGDIFYVHSRLLERSTHLRPEHGGGSLTALPIAETESQNLSAYIPTNLISITDGQIYVSPDLFAKGILPAVDVGKSVSRVGGKTQLPAYRSVAGDLKLAYAQFEELEGFARFGTRLDPNTRKALERGRRVRAVLEQDQYAPLTALQQIAILLAVTSGALDEVAIDAIPEAENRITARVTADLPEVAERIQSGQRLEDEDRDAILRVVRQVIQPAP